MRLYSKSKNPKIQKLNVHLEEYVKSKVCSFFLLSVFCHLTMKIREVIQLSFLHHVFLDINEKIPQIDFSHEK